MGVLRWAAAAGICFWIQGCGSDPGTGPDPGTDNTSVVEHDANSDDNDDDTGPAGPDDSTVATDHADPSAAAVNPPDEQDDPTPPANDDDPTPPVHVAQPAPGASCVIDGHTYADGAAVPVEAMAPATATCDNGAWFIEYADGASPYHGFDVCEWHTVYAYGCTEFRYGLQSTTRLSLRSSYGAGPLTTTARLYSRRGLSQCMGYTLSWGDGTVETSPAFLCDDTTQYFDRTHVYAQPGTYTVTLTALDGQARSKTVTVVP